MPASEPIHIAHIADTHLSYRKFKQHAPDGRNQRSADFAAVFLQAVDEIVRRHQARPFDAFVHAGDIFDRPRPDGPDVAVVASAIKQLQRAGIPQMWVSGNHDTAALRTAGHYLSMLRDIFQDDRTAFAVDYDVQVLRLEQVMIVGVAWGGWDRWDGMGDEWPITLDPRDMPATVLVTHGDISSSGILSVTHQDPLELPGFDLYDYVALGHLHDRPERCADVRYAGAPERSGWRDISNTAPGWLDVDVIFSAGADAVISCAIVPTDARPMIDLGVISAIDADDAIRQIDGPQDTAAIARVTVDGIAVSSMGSTRQKITAALADRYWQLQVDFISGGHTFVADEQRGAVEISLPSMGEMWQEFVTVQDDAFLEDHRSYGADKIAAATAAELEELVAG